MMHASLPFAHYRRTRFSSITQSQWGSRAGLPDRRVHVFLSRLAAWDARFRQRQPGGPHLHRMRSDSDWPLTTLYQPCADARRRIHNQSHRTTSIFRQTIRALIVSSSPSETGPFLAAGQQVPQIKEWSIDRPIFSCPDLSEIRFFSRLVCEPYFSMEFPFFSR